MKSGLSKEPGWAPTPNLELEGMIYGGLFAGQNNSLNSGNSLDVLPTCPTGNCTFLPLTSLVTCSYCRDVGATV